MSHASVLVAIEPTDDVEAAVAEQMAPFDEGVSGWFADGSRWDWFVIGGRFTALLSMDGYDPAADPRNWETCDLCGGTGDRATWRREARGEQHPSGCNGCVGKGTRRTFVNAPYAGDTCPRGVIDLAKFAKATFPAHYAFLRNRVWQEKERMGWWGNPARTECERAGVDTHICTHEKDGARIVSWSSSASWDKMFFPRFVEPLPPETLLVTVDYHV